MGGGGGESPPLFHTVGYSVVFKILLYDGGGIATIWAIGGKGGSPSSPSVNSYGVGAQLLPNGGE